MAPSVYTISFILEKIHRTLAQSFILSLRFQEHDWCSVGEFDESDLPVGFMFTTILSSFFNADKFTMEINVRNKTSFLACLHFSKNIGVDGLSIRGMSVLYPKNNDGSIMAITIAVKVVKYHDYPTGKVIPAREIDAQTDRVEMRTAQTQAHPHYTTTGSNTELHLLTATELEDTVAEVVAHHLDATEKVEVGIKRQATRGKTPTPVASPIPVPIEQKDLHLGKSLVPRLQKLRVLDKMIEERTALINQFDASLVKMELARKREMILKSRSLHLKMMQEETAKANRMLENLIKLNKPQKLATKDAAVQSEQMPSPVASSQSSSSRRSSASDSSTSSSSVDGEQATESSSSTSRSSSSRETVLRRNSATSTSTQASVEDLRSTANKSPPPKEDEHAEEPLSPTSLYLKQLREKILRERMQKI